MPIHRLGKMSETICMVRGKIVMRLYDEANVTDEFAIQRAGEWQMMQVEAGQRHLQEVLEGIYINQGAYTDFVKGRLRMVA